MNVSPIPLDRVELALPRVRHWLARAIEASPCDAWTLDGAEAAVRRGAAALWVAHTTTAHGVCLTELIPERAAARIVMLAGERMREWLPALQSVEDWARSWNCRVLEVPGRAGWTRLLAPQGYVQVGGELRKVL